jgi:uncharacterized LabA/DUF88 family protein
VESVRVMVFYDGAYFRQGNVYFRYKEKRGWFSLSELHSVFEKYVAAKAKAPIDVTKIVAAHHYDGRTTTQVVLADQLEKERDFEMWLVGAGIIPHYLPVRETSKAINPGEDPKFSLAQKGVDVNIAIDVLDLAHANRFDVAVLITGDEDFVPLVRRITSLDKHAMIAHFQIQPWTDERGAQHRGTFASRALLDAASWCLDFNQFIRDSDWKAEAKAMFFMPKQSAGGTGAA